MKKITNSFQNVCPSLSTNQKLKPILSFIPNIISNNKWLKTLHTKKTNNSNLSSLDAENHYSSVLVNEVIDTILKYVYMHSSFPPANLKATMLVQLLDFITKLPFHNRYGNIYTQTDSVAMGSYISNFICATEKIKYLQI